MQYNPRTSAGMLFLTFRKTLDFLAHSVYACYVMEETSTTSEHEINATATVSVGVKHAVVDAAMASVEVYEAEQMLEKACKEYDDYMDAKDKAHDDYGKGLITKEEYQFITDKKLEALFLANYLMCGENLYAKTIAAVAATGSAGKSIGTTFGFTGEAKLSIEGTETNTASSSTQTRGSNVFGAGGINISAGNNAKIVGSNITAGTDDTKGDIEINAKNVEILAGKNTTKSDVESKNMSMSVSINTSGGVPTKASFSESQTYDNSESLTYTNSSITGNNVTIKTDGDLTVSGAKIRAEEKLTADVSGNLLVESLQDTSTRDKFTIGGNVGANNSGGTSAGFNVGAERHERAWIENGKDKDGNIIGESKQTAMTGKTVDINVDEKTTLRGAVIASDTNDLNFVTGSFEYENIKDRDETFVLNVSGNINVGANQPNNTNGASQENANTTNNGLSVGGANDKDQDNDNTTLTADYGYDLKWQTNFATVGEGNFVVLDGSDTSGLNRNVQLAQYNTLDIGLHGSFEINDEILHPVDTVLGAWDGVKEGWEGLGLDIKELFGLGIENELKFSRDIYEFFKNRYPKGELSDAELLYLAKYHGEILDIMDELGSEKATEKEATTEKLKELYHNLYKNLSPLDAQKLEAILLEQLKGIARVSQGSLLGDGIPQSAAENGCALTTIYMAFGEARNYLGEEKGFVGLVQYYLNGISDGVVGEEKAHIGLTSRAYKDHVEKESKRYLEPLGYTMIPGDKITLFNTRNYKEELSKDILTANSMNMLSLRINDNHSVLVIGGIIDSKGNVIGRIKDPAGGDEFRQYIDPKTMEKFNINSKGERENPKPAIFNEHYKLTVTRKDNKQ